MSYDKKETVISGNQFKRLTCRASECKHNSKTMPQCTHDWIEMDSPGFCLFFTRRTLDDFPNQENI